MGAQSGLRSGYSGTNTGGFVTQTELNFGVARLVPDAIGFYFYGPKQELLDTFYKVTCPCGVTDTRPVNLFPTEDTPHKCGKPNHWFVKYKDCV